MNREAWRTAVHGVASSRTWLTDWTELNHNPKDYRKKARSNQSILKEINPEYLPEGLMRKPKLQYFGHLMQIVGSLEKAMRFGKIEGRRGKGWQWMRCWDGITGSVGLSLSRLWRWWRKGSLACCGPWAAAVLQSLSHVLTFCAELKSDRN